MSRGGRTRTSKAGASDAATMTPREGGPLRVVVLAGCCLAVAVALTVFAAPAMARNASATVARAGDHATSARAKGLTRGQRRRADKLISNFENSTSTIQYCYIEALGDGRGYTAGRAGFTSATSDLLEVAERYTRIVPGNPLSPLLPRLRELAPEEDGSIEGLEALPDAWRTTCRDRRQRLVQDAVVNEEYYFPARRHWRKRKLRRALSLAAIYDAEIQHGDGDDPDGVPAMLRRAKRLARRLHGGTRESRFLRAFVRVRKRTLLHAFNEETRAEWRESAGRADVWRYLIRTRQWNMASPVRVRTREYHLRLR